MNTPRKWIDLNNLVNAVLTDVGDGRSNLNFPQAQIDFDFKTHPDTDIFDVMVVRGLYFLGTYDSQVLLVEYLGETKAVNFACQALNLSIGASYPGEDISFLPVQVIDVEDKRVLVAICSSPVKQYWLLSKTDQGQINFISTRNGC